MKTRLLIILLAGIISLLITLVILQNFVESKELSCLSMYKDINEISRTNGMLLAERETIQKHRDLIFEYVEKDCPNFQDLEFIYNNYKQNSLNESHSIESKQEPLLKIELTDLSNTYKVGETVSFTIIESGYGNPCTAPHIVIFDENSEVFWDYRLVKKCPQFSENYPIHNIVKIPPENSDLTQFIKSGKYLINVDSGKAHMSKEITVSP